ncbi:uncharacterized protein LOC111624849 [Centruroides sculpturatus]|uniref:uncharacterized protein LOC111624849 n=1 Tax=Centruroides sculpturatus TaxID=218467 RepID=UPI000C6D6E69|nr:uncharacterized protein LOC111624849 [Centruroides sculpturatus]
MLPLLFVKSIWQPAGRSVTQSVMAASSSNSINVIQGSAWFQKKINLLSVSRGCHLITEELVNQIPELARFSVGVFHLQNWDQIIVYLSQLDSPILKVLSPNMPSSLTTTTPFRHSCEGPDDMPAHIKSCFLGSSLTIPITDGQLNLGTWQGIWLCEHRNRAGSRKVIVTINGALKD